MKKPCFHPEAGLLFVNLAVERSVFFSVAVAFAAMAEGAGSLFLVAAEAEFVRLLLVNAARKWPRRPFMALGAGVHSHVLGVVEIYVAVIGLEDLCFGKGDDKGCQQEGVAESFHVSNSVTSYRNDADLYDRR
jgi:hypothetical protein